jgi:hypothetical protein
MVRKSLLLSSARGRAISGGVNGQREELRQAVGAALARYGVAGELSIDAECVTLTGSGPTVSSELGTILARWDSIAFDERQRLSLGLARALVAQRRAVNAAAPRRRRPPIALFSAGIVAVIGAAVFLRSSLTASLSGLLGGAAAPAAAPRVASHEQQDRERAARAERVCAATRARLLRGGSVGPTDAEGWVVEVSLLTGAAGASPHWGRLDGFVERGDGARKGRLIWPGSKLSELSGIMTAVEVEELRLPDAAPSFLQLTITLSGEYVLPYFLERDRIELVRFAHALAKDQDARFGALYARCAGSHTHDLGAWFAGASAGDASAALLYFMGAHSYPVQLERRVLSQSADDGVDPAFTLTSLIEATDKIDRRQVASMIGGQDGMVAEAEGITSIRFPFIKASSATRASLAVGRRLKVASGVSE